MKFLQTVLSCIFISLTIFAQSKQRDVYPVHYFRNPLNIPISLAGNFGELRPNHYHMGLDIRTQKKENLPVYAAADGYIAKIKIEPAGFGQAIYINHPNGYTTVYAHLNAFFPALAAWVKKEQYRQQSWNIFPDLPPGIFPVKKGDLIAYSGNTGGSEAPHLHFEIRDTKKDINKNPMLFGFAITDETKPAILRLACYNRSMSIYEQSPSLISLQKSGDDYYVSGSLITVGYPKISFAVSAFDTQSGSTNKNGIFSAALLENGKQVESFTMNDISYVDTRNINAHVDYKTKSTGGPWLQQLFRLPGYVQGIYSSSLSDGIIDLSDGAVHAIAIEVRDAYGNTSALRFNVKFNGLNASPKINPAKMFYPNMLDGLELTDCAFYLGEKCLYDSVRINYAGEQDNAANSVSALHRIGAGYIPLQDYVLVQIKPTKEIIPDDRMHIVMERITGTKKEVQRVTWKNDWASARFREFGSFHLLSDTEAPVITPLGFHNGSNLSKSSRLIIQVKDNLGAFTNFRATLDGNWICFSNDKGKSFLYKFDEHFPPGKHILKIHVEDLAGNIAEKSLSISR